MKLLRGWGSGPAITLMGPGERFDSTERWQRSIRRAAKLTTGVPPVDAQLRALMWGARVHFRRDQPR